MLSKSKARLGQFVKSKKINVFGAFLLLSFLMLVIIKLSENYNETLTYKLSFRNLPDKEVLVLDEQPKVEVGVSGFGFYLFKEYFKTKTIIVDFENDVYKSNNLYVWLTQQHTDDIENQIGAGLELNFIRPDSIKFPFEVLNVKKVPVQINANIGYLPGYDSLEGLEIEPDSINVIGTIETLETIDSIETAVLEKRDVNSDLNHRLGLIAPKTTGTLKLSQDAVIVMAEVSKFTEGNFDIPIKLINVPRDLKINYFPKQISVSFLVSLDNFKSVKPEDFEIICDYNTVTNAESTFLIPVLTKKPDIVKNVKMRQKKVEYIINQ